MKETTKVGSRRCKLVGNLIIFLSLIDLSASTQTFETLPNDIFPGGKPRFSDILVTPEGSLFMGCSMGICQGKESSIQIDPAMGSWPVGNAQMNFFGKNSNIYKDLYEGRPGMTILTEGQKHVMFVVDEDGNPGCYNHSTGMGILLPPFNLPLIAGHRAHLTNIFFDPSGDLFLATGSDVFFLVKSASEIFNKEPGRPYMLSYMWGLDKDSDLVITTGAKDVRTISLGKGIIPLTFKADPDDPRDILVGTNSGIYAYDKVSGDHIDYVGNPEFKGISVTDIDMARFGTLLWFCSPDKGVGVYNEMSKGIRYFPLRTGRNKRVMPVQKFSRLSDHEFLVATTDTLPAVLDVGTGSYHFLDDSLFHDRSTGNSDIRLDRAGDLFLIRDGKLYWSKKWLMGFDASRKEDTSLAGPYVTDIRINDFPLSPERRQYLEMDSFNKVTLNPGESNMEVFFDCRGVDHDSLSYSWTMDEEERNWHAATLFPLGGNANFISLRELEPGRHHLRIRAKSGVNPWLIREARLAIEVEAPYWKKAWFWALVSLIFLALLWAIIRWRETVVRKRERKRTEFEKRAMELEAKALRAQMDPHFIFNCMNSIKSLIQQDHPELAVIYLTTFSKLLRTVLDNSDKRDITLHEELETCRLYAELEVMRFGNRFRYQAEVEEAVDLKSIRVPALILQPFIENAIWHGLLPKEKDGLLRVEVKRVGEMIQCTIEDNGVGRHTGKKGIFSVAATDHESKGIRLTRNRLELDNILFQRKAELEIVDKTDESGRAAGTKVILTFSEF